MRVNTTFTTKARCATFSNSQETVERLDIELTFDINSASHLLFRFGSSRFLIGKYHTNIVPAPNKNLNFAITLYDPDTEKTYYVANPETLLSDVLSGYEQLRLLQKASSLLGLADLNLEGEDNSDEVLDEFELPSEEE